MSGKNWLIQTISKSEDCEFRVRFLLTELCKKDPCNTQRCCIENCKLKLKEV